MKRLLELELTDDILCQAFLWKKAVQNSWENESSLQLLPFLIWERVVQLSFFLLFFITLTSAAYGQLTATGRNHRGLFEFRCNDY